MGETPVNEITAHLRTPLYFDYQSAKPVDPRVVDAMMPFFTEKFGNPASLHGVGDMATDALESARRDVAEFVGAEPEEVVFTSGATEASNLALLGYARRYKSKGNHVVVSEVEHISIHNLAKVLSREGFEVSKVPVDQYGRVSLEKLEARIRPETLLVSVCYANNEVGTVQPVREVAKVVHERGAAFHCDAVAAEGLLPIDVKKDGVDLLTLSSNDIYGPRGVGALVVRKGLMVAPQIIGGGQERGLRSGTENLAGIVGMAEACKLAQAEMESEVARLTEFRGQIVEKVLEIPKSHLNGHPTERLANNSHFRFDGIEGESILLSFKERGISVATGSACSSKTLEPSHTLIAMGLLHEEAHGSLEITTGRFTTQEDVDALLAAAPEVVARLRKLSPMWEDD
ncbi:MAG: cysteine desulfurase family protein [Promethearchaeota archaeon]